MYEQFGAIVNHANKTVTFKLFVPDGERDPYQYEGGGLPRLKDVFVVGSFQNAAHKQWNLDRPLRMKANDYLVGHGGPPKGVLYSYTTAALPNDTFYEYKYRLDFEQAPTRYITDPCGKYGGITNQNSGFVIGGEDEEVKALDRRLPYRDLMIYELMIDDFTTNIQQAAEAPLQTVIRKLPHLVKLGINAIEFMPWTAWTYPTDPSKDFSWGYNPVQYFSVAHKYTLNPTNEANKLVYLKRLINACHALGIHVIMDGVFNHADATPPDRGFPYYWLYQEPADSPYVGNFAEAAFFKDLDYTNQCTLEYIRDACMYWMDTFQIDGIRFDNTAGMYRAGDRGHGVPKLLSELRGHISQKGYLNFSLILEHEWNYGSIDVTNKVGATSCWLDPFRSLSMSFLGDRPQGVPQIEPSIMRMLDSARDFDANRTPTIYIENHDHKRFMLKAGGRDYWSLTQPYVIALFTCAGATLIYNGQEFGQSNDMPESGEGRVVSRPVEWNIADITPGPDIQALYQTLISIRKKYPALSSPNFYPRNWDESQQSRDADGFGIDRGKNVVVYHRWEEDDHQRVERFYIVLNFSQDHQHVDFAIPIRGPWKDLLSEDMVNDVNGRLQVEVGSNWGRIFYRKD